MSVRGGDIVFDIKGNDSGYRYTIGKIEKDAKKSGSKIGSNLSSSLNNSLSKSTKNIGKNLTSNLSNTISKSLNGVGSKIGKSISPAFASAGAAAGTSMGAGIMGALAAVPVAGWIAAAVVAVSTALFKITDKVATWGDQIDKNSQKMNMSYRGYQQWSYILDRCGASIDKMQAPMKTLQNAAVKGNEAFTKLGISQEELANSSPEQLFNRTIFALQGVENKTQRTYLASQLLGRGATELGGLLNMTQQDTQDLAYRLDYLGGVMSNKGVANSAAFKDAITDLRTQLKGFGDIIATYVAPVFTWLINKIFIPAVRGIRVACSAIGQAISWLVGVVKKALSFILAPFKAIFGLLGRIPIVGKAIEGVKGAFRNFFSTGSKNTTKQALETADAMEGISTGMGNTGKNAKKAKKEVQALKREILGFDKITKLSGEEKGTSMDTGISAGAGGISSGGDIGSLGGGGLDDFGIVEEQEKTKGKLAQIWEDIKGYAREKWEAVKQIANEKWEGVRNNILKWSGKSLEEWENMTFKEKVATVATAIRNYANNAFQKNFGVTLEEWNDLTFKEKLAVIKTAWKDANDKIEKLGPEGVIKEWNNLTFTEKMAAVKNAWKNPNGYVDANSLTNMQKSWKDMTLPEKIATAKLQYKNVKNQVIQSLTGVPLDEWKKMTFAEKKATVTANFKNNVQSAWNNFIKWWNKLKGGTKTFGVNFSLRDAVKNTWNALVRTIDKARAKSAIARNVLPNLPFLAQGGYVKANTPRLAVIGDNKTQGEIVAPENKLQDMANKAAGNNDETNALLRQLIAVVSSMNLNVELDGEKIKTNTVNRINNHTRATGQLEIII